MAGGWCYVKELIQPHYGKFFNDAGFATLIFDYARFGDSTGEPRQHIDPNSQIEDYRNAISFVATLPEVDPQRIGVWGISYSGGHALVLAATDHRIRSVVSNIPVVNGYRNMRRVHGTVGFRNLMQAIRDDREERYRNGSGGIIKHATLDYDRASSTWPFPETRRRSSTSSSARRPPTRTRAPSTRPSCSCTTTCGRSWSASSTFRR